MKQQTAVEFAVEKLEKFIPSGNQLAVLAIFEQAKQIEKQQIEIAFEQGMINSADYYIPQASGREIVPECENYYNETYKND
jgi:hypothetical protein